jgi:hypothetical protein
MIPVKVAGNMFYRLSLLTQFIYLTIIVIIFQLQAARAAADNLNLATG